jgi:hypothetical protein
VSLLLSVDHVGSDVQAVMNACKQVREKAGAAQRNRSIRDICKFLEEIEVSLNALSFEL